MRMKLTINDTTGDGKVDHEHNKRGGRSADAEKQRDGQTLLLVHIAGGGAQQRNYKQV